MRLKLVIVLLFIWDVLRYRNLCSQQDRIIIQKQIGRIEWSWDGYIIVRDEHYATPEMMEARNYPQTSKYVVWEV